MRWSRWRAVSPRRSFATARARQVHHRADRGWRQRRRMRKAAYAIGHSPLVKTAFFASDPNLAASLPPRLRRIDDLDRHASTCSSTRACRRSGGRRPSYLEEDGHRVMKQSEITVRVDLHRGAASATVWTATSARSTCGSMRLPLVTNPCHAHRAWGRGNASDFFTCCRSRPLLRWPFTDRQRP